MSLETAYNENNHIKLQFYHWRVLNFLPKKILVMRYKSMSSDDENWVWRNMDKSHEPSLSLCGQSKIKCWNGSAHLKYIPLDPPIEFQDNPLEKLVEKFAVNFISKLISEAFMVSCKITWSIPCSQVCHKSDSLSFHNTVMWNSFRLCWTPELMPNVKHPNGLSTCLSASHNSLSTIGSNNVDVSDHIKSAISHDVLTSKQISDMYNVPFDSDIYAVPVDVVQNRNSKPANTEKVSIHRSKYCYSSGSTSDDYILSVASSESKNSSQSIVGNSTESNLSSLLGQPQCDSATTCSTTEPIHVTVDEVRQYLKTLYSNPADLRESFPPISKDIKAPFTSLQNHNFNHETNILNSLKTRNKYVLAPKNKKTKESVQTSARLFTKPEPKDKFKRWSNRRPSFSSSIKETLCNIFRFKKLSTDQCLGRREINIHGDEIGMRLSGHEDQNPPSPITKPPFSKRALPAPPKREESHGEIIVTDSTPLPSPEDVSSQSISFTTKSSSASVDFASSIEKVKDCGWYWGPISGKVAEKILSNEPDGSFIVRDSSDDYYIFSLTFKLNSIIRHVRIEHDQGNFSFGSSTRFKSHTIVDFIESAVEHSRSGRYLFFLHRRPVLGPMRVQLLHPVSRFKQVQSLQHMCRFVILKLVRRDLIPYLPLPRRILDYLSTQHYYSENLLGDDRSDSSKDDHLEQLWAFDREVFS